MVVELADDFDLRDCESDDLLFLSAFWDSTTGASAGAIKGFGLEKKANAGSQSERDVLVRYIRFHGLRGFDHSELGWFIRVSFQRWDCLHRTTDQAL